MPRSTTVIGSLSYLRGDDIYIDTPEEIIRIEGNACEDLICFDFNPGIHKDDVITIRIEPEALMQALTRALRRCDEPKES